MSCCYALSVRCQHCDYLLFNLTRAVCPECGQPFSIETYAFEPGHVSFNCPHCDQDYYGNDARGLPWPRQFVCVQCKQSIALEQMRVVPLHPDAMGVVGGLKRSPWDRRHELGLFRAWWNAFTMTLVRPGTFFREHTGTSIKEAWLFSMMSLYIGMLPYFLYQIVLMWGFGAMTATLVPAGAPPPLPPLAFLAIGYILAGLVLPLFMQFIVGGVWACTIQLALWVLAPGRKPLEYTFRTALYSFGPYALYLVPVCGGTVGGIWQVVTLILGIKEVHGIGGWRASIAVLWPLVVLIGLYVVIIAVLVFVFATGQFGGS